VSAAGIPFNRPYTTGNEFGYIQEAVANGHISGNGPFSARCVDWLERSVGSPRALLTHSCTGALEMAAILADLGPGDEVIMPSFTFVSTANAAVLRGAVPVFVDVREDTLNIDESQLEAAITERTRAIVVVHYAGVACEMDAICAFAERYGLVVIEDAAQAILASYHGRPLGSFGSYAALSFHETKNIQCGEGGALLVNDPARVDRAEIVHEKGTNRRAFFQGLVDKYTWVDVGSSYLLSDVAAAFLWAQLERAAEIVGLRRAIWDAYHAGLAELEETGLLRRPIVPDGCSDNAHIYYVLLPTPDERERVLRELNESGVNAVFHYVPLHTAAAGIRYGRAVGSLAVTTSASARLLRLPLWAGMAESEAARVLETVQRVVARSAAGVGS
jgi:dTDP-4-amino-4,6-dideoxygalactose transaminase